MYGENYLPLTHMLSSFPRKSSYKVVYMLYKCNNDTLSIYDVCEFPITHFIVGC